jgi:hypothetical protein
MTSCELIIFSYVNNLGGQQLASGQATVEFIRVDRVEHPVRLGT